jgi:hypothetical protein
VKTCRVITTHPPPTAPHYSIMSTRDKAHSGGSSPFTGGSPRHGPRPTKHSTKQKENKLILTNWVTQLIRIIWKYVLAMWTSRNDDEHGRTPEERYTAKHQRLSSHKSEQCTERQAENIQAAVSDSTSSQHTYCRETRLDPKTTRRKVS